MSFGGLNFVFDGQYSEFYGLQIMSINGGLTSESSGGCGIEVFKDSVYRNPQFYHQGVAQKDALTFDLELISEDEIVGALRSKISKWLFGRMTYCKLQIVQRDLEDVYFNCHLLNPTFIYIGNRCHGVKCSVECDAPWAWQNTKTYQITDLKGKGMTDALTVHWNHYNDSDDADYTYPVLEFKMASSFVGNGRCSITNATDDGREFAFKNMIPGEVVTVDCRSQAMLSSKGTQRGKSLSEDFNKHFFRLLPGANDIELVGEFEYLKMSYANARKVGG